MQLKAVSAPTFPSIPSASRQTSVPLPGPLCLGDLLCLPPSCFLSCSWCLSSQDLAPWEEGRVCGLTVSLRHTGVVSPRWPRAQ